MTIFFQFEADFVDSLRCIPMYVRYKLDICGIKLKLVEWNQMNQSQRQNLIDLPTTTETEVDLYREYLQNLIFQKTGKFPSELPIDPRPAWINSEEIPEYVGKKVTEIGLSLALTDWQNLTYIQRFALIKLSRSHHENENFPKAMAEFNLGSRNTKFENYIS
ncbi:nitrate reductase associated protein [Calothrix sp. PCC 6303]|uniref:nitrate reductase associated protein n=1 Tax=Calothrix sp. PCC 6303 TaxID=1170562 RepID=UPI0002A029B7|nr:nitrate reductase associated protein [Calothrix sp. PCC 6303]AFZ00322.1 hypothetical protein Cal6303_1261 [Calothrix sp. PCC 6303]